MAIGLYAFHRGDESVGIPSEAWRIENVGELDAYVGQREAIRKAFQDAFLTITDEIRIVFSDEIVGGD